MEQRNEFDIVLWGATGFVGRLVAEGLAARFPDGGLRWAIGGRNQEKLEAVRSSLPTSTDIPIIVGDSHDLASLEAFVTRTKVVCSVVGPYAKYGSELVKACVRHGTDYCDLTGEAHWIRNMIDAHQSEAERSGARIVNSCGFDSIPSDFGVFFLQQAAQHLYDAQCPQVRMRVTAMKGGFSGGTAASLVHGMETGPRDKSILRYMTEPYSLCPPNQREGPDPPDKMMSVKVEYDSDLEGWTKPFFMAPANCKIVRRTNALLGYPYGRDFRYEEASWVGGGIRGWLRATGGAYRYAAFLGLMVMPPTRWLLKRFLLPKSGEGPSRKVRESGFWRIALVGTLPSGEILRAQVSGEGDPGELSTSRMLIESALCLVEDSDRLSAKGGLWTPASAMGDVLLSRLRANAGLSFELEQEEPQPRRARSGGNDEG